VKDLIEFIARSLVNDPSQVEVNQVQRGSSAEISLSVAKEDMGRIFGKKGRVANATRALLRVAAAREGKRVTLDILEPR
jgi:predicted RNA-binding protein YlqC (UPF0109 family)